MKCKVFKGVGEESLEEKVNDFLERNPNISISHVQLSGGSGYGVYLSLFYETEEETQARFDRSFKRVNRGFGGGGGVSF